jgi:PHP family Zn ribbon phosphoesterase
MNRTPRHNEIIKFDSAGMYPDCDNRYYRVIGKYKNEIDILNIHEIDIETGADLDTEHTQVIVKFRDGYNNYISILKRGAI